ncbi:MAG: FHA domain-containing protein, partial [bacterium]|nr:FHA domain-containing protein [bacterium]
KQKEELKLKTFRETLYHLSMYSDQIRLLFEKELSAFSIDIILNQVRAREEIKMGNSLKDVLTGYYGIRALYTGAVYYNENLWKYNNRFCSLFDTYPSCSTLLEIGDIARGLTEGKERPRHPDAAQAIPVFLVADTPGAVQAMNGKKILEITRFPFKAGRLSKRKLDNFLKNNDYYLNDDIPYSFSRSHFAIEEHEGRFYFRDRGSRFGSIVNNKEVGGDLYNVTEIPLRRGENSLKFSPPSKDLAFTILVNEPE